MKPRFEKHPRSEGSSFLVAERNESSFSVNWHSHAEYELTYIVGGRGQRSVGNHIAVYGEGDLVLLGPDLPHTWVSDPSSRDNRAVYVQFSGDFLGAQFLSIPEMTPVLHLLDLASRGLGFDTRPDPELGRDLIELSKLAGLRRLSAWLSILERLSNLAPSAAALATRGYRSPLALNRDERIEALFGYLHDNGSRPISIDMLAERMHMSRSSFCRLFRRLTGKSLMDYLIDMRIERACFLLRETGDPVTGIALAAGFESLPYFNRCFKARRGMKPREYRAGWSGR
ncbi:MAG: helix-turn-helix domain-containing protein [Rectinemataceae bacterium]